MWSEHVCILDCKLSLIQPLIHFTDEETEASEKQSDLSNLTHAKEAVHQVYSNRL